MDTLTHMVLGACIGQAVGYKKLGKKALVYGALGGLLPDLDVFITPFMGEFGGWKYHRHVTHGILFPPIVGFLMGYGLWRHYKKEIGTLSVWLAIMFLSLSSHLLLDYCTIYGTQLLAPFSNQRFEIPAISIIDPIYTLILLSAILTRGLFRQARHVKGIAILAITLSALYILCGLYLNNKAEKFAIEQLEEQQISYSHVRAYTTIFQPFLRRIVVTDDNIIRAGFVSTLSPQEIVWGCQNQVDRKIRDTILETEEAKIFYWFSSGNLGFAKDPKNEKLISVTDTRYGIPGPSLFGWWGQSYLLDSGINGTMSAVYIGNIRYERDASFHAIKNLFRAAYGYDNDFMMRSPQGCP